MVLEKFNDQTGILETLFNGEVTLLEVVNYIIRTKENKKYPRTLKIFTDSSDAIFNFSIEDLNIIMEENLKSLKNYSCIIDAIIVDNPKNTVLTMLYAKLAETKKYKFKVFATKEAALDWLQLN
ncbi:hypothetical protein BX611_0943 [Lutibacter oceani]|uniref:SpoIIAA-like protein n=1 Tax=Lutibacter oceani TaxID=1853311 RepID=A0A3D9RUJ9_9FLAO|nr:hypothetical protein [Lutibacter oceani]REE83649.1 hypothetical protein BX611_0943 [Lutibacter oceani]